MFDASKITTPMQSTLSIPWTKSSVQPQKIAKGSGPFLNYEALWADPSGKSFYAYDGELSFWYGGSSIPPPNQLWEFSSSDGGGSGQWSQISISPASNFSSLVRTIASSNSFSGELGFAMGGLQRGRTDDQVTAGVPGMTIFNMSSTEWYNVSTAVVTSDSTTVFGSAQYVPYFGPSGLFITLGGLATDVGFVTDDEESTSSWFPLNNISMYEPSSQTWRSQMTTGEAPQGLSRTCVVGTEGDDNTYEVSQDHLKRKSKR